MAFRFLQNSLLLIQKGPGGKPDGTFTDRGNGARVAEEARLESV